MEVEAAKRAVLTLSKPLLDTILVEEVLRWVARHANNLTALGEGLAAHQTLLHGDAEVDDTIGLNITC